MLFSSLTFLLLFLPIVFISNLILPKKAKNLFLVFASLIFYAWGEPTYVILMMISIAGNYGIGLLMDRHQAYKKGILAVGVVLNLAILGYFKYYDFVIQTINQLLRADLLQTKQIALPIGISFFTFQAISYIIDLYRGQYKVQKNLINMALYISFFPQLIAGPIVKYKDINQQIESRKISADGIAAGMRRFVYGLGKKVLIANVVASYADRIYALDIGLISPSGAWVAAICYMLQIYYDFSGYSDMAIGLGKIFGFDFLENFHYPYLSASIHEFWQRWHISLGTWFKEYVYFPLGGNRKGKKRTYVNLSIVFLLTGLWHGASWTFVVWGLYHGFFQILERLGLERVLGRTRIIKHIYALLVIVFGWVLFRADNLLVAIKLIARMVIPWHYHIPANVIVDSQLVVIGICALLGCGILQSAAGRLGNIKQYWKYSIPELLFCICVGVLSFAALASNTYNPFIYFRF